MKTASYLILSSLMVLFGYLVFRVKVRRDYERRERLSAISTLLECLVFCLHANLSYTFLPARWPDLPSLPDNEFQKAAGLGILAIGIVVTLWSMISLRLRDTLGQQTRGLYRSGFYRYSRNPQIVVYGLVVIGLALLWPSIYSLGWILVYGAIAHMMVRTEEEHLGRIFGSEYEDYCVEVPRYLPWP
ncbi:MAG: isoprenylcysteine carboxylmethyltransferase family protein [Candidatus Eisenbacteria sp.]|nr:isoprenylcysteine carboxylmethyltransferase family protein [Candidatus Eisenbacteria bacterium]